MTIIWEDFMDKYGFNKNPNIFSLLYHLALQTAHAKTGKYLLEEKVM